MKYYYLIDKLDDKTGSCFVNNMIGDHEYTNDKGVYAFSRIEFPEIEEIKYLLLLKDRNPLDVLSATMLRLTGLLMNKSTMKLFSSFNLPPHRFYSTLIKDYMDNIHQYYWLQTGYERDQKSYLDYKKSSFYWQKDFGNVEREEIEINSLQDIIDFRKNLSLGQGIKIKKAVLNKEFSNLHIDLFKIGRLSIDWIISDRLKIALEENEITGISFKEADNLIVDS